MATTDILVLEKNKKRNSLESMSGILKARRWSLSDMVWSPVAILRICRKMSEEMMFYCSTRQVKIFPSLKFLNFSAEKKFGESMVLYRSLVRRANVGLYFACARFCSALELCFAFALLLLLSACGVCPPTKHYCCLSCNVNALLLS